VLPGLGGRELAERARGMNPDLRALFVSGYTGNGLLHQTAIEPGTPFRAKPFSGAALLAKVREVLDAEPAGGPPRRGS
jgi:CheY-like chemotaxis protein